MASIDMIVLSLLQQKDMYGFEIIETLSTCSNHFFDMKTGTLYPLLRKLEDKGAIISYESASQTGRTRKYYHITATGKNILQRRQKEWFDFTSLIHAIMKGDTTHHEE